MTYRTRAASLLILAAVLASTALPAHVNAAEESPANLVTGTIRVSTIIDDGEMSPRILTTFASADNVNAHRRSLKSLSGNPVRVDARVNALGSDPRRAEQWGLDAHSFPAAWQQSTGANVTVAVIDSGVDAGHPDLAGRVLPGKDYVSGGDGRTDDNGHGTHVAGIIAANTGNGVGIAGAAPGVNILPVKVLDGNGSGWDSDVAAGIIWAADNGASVINLSLGGAADPLTAEAIIYAQQRGALIVAAGGNSGSTTNAPSYPAAYPQVMAVAAASSTTSIANYSTRGSYIDITAAGTAILSTYPQGAYGYSSGTSMSAPFVSAAAAVIFSSAPGITAQAVSSRLLTYSRDMGEAGPDLLSGSGLLDVAAALCQCVTGTPPPVGAPPVAPPAGGTPPTVPGLPSAPELPDTVRIPTLPRLPSVIINPPAVTNPTPGVGTGPAPGAPGGAVQALSVAISSDPWVVQGQERDVKVNVYDPSGLPLRGALVELVGEPDSATVTNAKGSASVSFLAQGNTRYTLAVRDSSGARAESSFTSFVAPDVRVRAKKGVLSWTLNYPQGQAVNVTARKGSVEKLAQVKITQSGVNVAKGKVRMRKGWEYTVHVNGTLNLIPAVSAAVPG
jgi:serine protease